MIDRTRFISRWLCALACGGSILLSGCGGGGGGSAADVNPPPPTVPPLGTLSLLAGKVGGSGSIDGVPGRFAGASGLAVDAAGSVYVADSNNHTIRKVTAAGVTTLAGTSGQAGFRDGAGTFALFADPTALAVDAAGNVYVADSLNAVIRKISPAGVVSGLAGSPGAWGYADGTGAAARFDSFFRAMTLDSAGNLYVTEQNSNLIRKITAAGVVTTIAGGTKFSFPTGIAVDSTGNVYVAEAGKHQIRKISPAGEVTTLAGMTTVGDSGGFADGPPGVARFDTPSALAIDSQGVLFVLDNSGRVRKITSDGVVTSRVARNADGSSKFFSPSTAGLALDTAGNVYVADVNAIHRLDPEDVVTTVAGTLPSSGRADGLGSAASFFSPGSLGLDNSGNVYVADIGNNSIRRITPAGATTTVATNVGANQVQAQGVVSGALPFFNIAGDKAGNIIVTDESSHLVRRLMPDGSLATVAGSQWPDGTPVYSPRGLVSFAGRSRPQAVAGDGMGNIYIIDGNRIRKITLAGGDSFVTCGPDNYCLPTNDAFPTGIAADASGNVYVANRYTIVKIAPAGTSVILAGNSASGGYTDGSGTEAKFNLPAALAVDAFGNVFVADTRNHAVRKVTPAGVVTTIAGRPGASGVQVGNLPASLASPTGIVVAADGTIYVSSENAVLKIQP